MSGSLEKCVNERTNGRTDERTQAISKDPSGQSQLLLVV